jgi:hypothetical protein
MRISGAIAVLMLFSCGRGTSGGTSQLEFLSRGELIYSVAQESCMNFGGNRFFTPYYGQPIPNQYLIIMTHAAQVTPQSAGEMLSRHAGSLLFIQPSPAYAFAAHMNEEDARALAKEPGICQVGQDFLITN